MSRDQMESVVRSVETLLAEAEALKARCRGQSEEVAAATEALRREGAELQEQCARAQVDMVEIRRNIDQLLDTKAAFEAKERQVRKLSKQL
uniref:Si:ch211-285j22.3 n=1 Tax=Lepisosteus oculatus TaxID=7918 RepID=W5NM57_LEPOC